MAVVDNRYLIIMRDCSIQKVSVVTHLIASKGRPFDSEGDRGGTHYYRLGIAALLVQNRGAVWDGLPVKQTIPP